MQKCYLGVLCIPSSRRIAICRKIHVCGPHCKIWEAAPGVAACTTWKASSKSWRADHDIDKTPDKKWSTLGIGRKLFTGKYQSQWTARDAARRNDPAAEKLIDRRTSCRRGRR